MSRAFVKDDVPDGPPIIPPRAPLPAGVPNYVTPRGLALLREERAALEAERARRGAEDGEDAERQRELTVVAGRLAALTERLAHARLVDPKKQAPDTVRFGATVTVQTDAGQERRFQIVGVDEADAAAGRVAFTVPVACAVTGKHVGETAKLRTPQGEETLTVTAITYDAA
ncbi:MAG: GreA/GreB family elongation factor [Rhodothermales bacterium]